MKKTAKELVLEYVRKQYEKEKDKWNCGMKNSYFEWEDLLHNLEDILK